MASVTETVDEPCGRIGFLEALAAVHAADYNASGWSRTITSSAHYTEALATENACMAHQGPANSISGVP